MNLDDRAVQTDVIEADGHNLFGLQPGKDSVQNSRLAPAVHARVDRMPIAKMLRQAAPFAAMLNHIQQRVEPLQIGHADVAALARQAIGDALKLVLG